MGRFLAKLIAHEDLVEACFESMVEKLRHLLPGFGQKLVVDSTDIKAFSNGHRRRKSDPDARWSAKGITEGKQEQGKKRDLYYWFGYKLHLLVDGIYELPVSFSLTPANESDTQQMPVLLEKAKLKRPDVKADAIIADKGYDSQKNYQLIYEEYSASPIIPIKERAGMQLPDICNARGTPTCSCGLEMAFWG